MTPGDNPIHLLRALLRQCTYLPDSAAREYLHRHIIARYRAKCPRFRRPPQPGPPLCPKPETLGTQKQHLLQTARDGLALLHRANSGYMRALTKVLALTYGRTGKRRHELLSLLQAPDIPSDQTAVASLSASLTTTPTFNVPPRLEALVKSQIQQGHTDFVNPPLKQVAPRIPKQNIWRRPVPMKRVRNIQRNWLNMVLERAMPPLPEEEWERLRRLANGELKWEGPVQRRAKVEESREKDGSLFPERGFDIEELDKRMGSRTTGFKDSPHKINGRLMRRLWARTFRQSPVMKWNATKKSWYFEWGRLGSADGVGDITRNIPQLSPFDGVDEDGMVPHQS